MFLVDEHLSPCDRFCSQLLRIPFEFRCAHNSPRHGILFSRKMYFDASKRGNSVKDVLKLTVHKHILLRVHSGNKNRDVSMPTRLPERFHVGTHVATCTISLLVSGQTWPIVSTFFSTGSNIDSSYRHIVNFTIYLGAKHVKQ